MVSTPKTGTESATRINCKIPESLQKLDHFRPLLPTRSGDFHYTTRHGRKFIPATGYYEYRIDVSEAVMSEAKRLRVFVVDDEPVIAFTLATILESAGYTARSFSDPLKPSGQLKRTAQTT
jgi:hypothetical protein